MKPEDQWRLYVTDSERFCRNPLKDEVKLWTAIGGLAAIVIINFLHFVWG